MPDENRSCETKNPVKSGSNPGPSHQKSKEKQDSRQVSRSESPNDQKIGLLIRLIDHLKEI
jgi:hypothetical protein